MEKTNKRIFCAVLGLCAAISVSSASAFYIDDVEKAVGADASQSTLKKKPILLAGEGPAVQVVCIDKIPVGSRIKKRRCKTVNQWNTKIRHDHMKLYLLEP